MRSPLCVATGGWCRRVFHYRPPTPMYRNSPPLCTIVLQIPSLMPLKMRKVQIPWASGRAISSKKPAYSSQLVHHPKPRPGRFRSVNPASRKSCQNTPRRSITASSSVSLPQLTHLSSSAARCLGQAGLFNCASQRTAVDVDPRALQAIRSDGCGWFRSTGAAV